MTLQYTKYWLHESGIAAELYVPRKRRSGMGAVYLPGLPGWPGENPTIRLMIELGFTVIVPQYLGSYESDGHFTPKNCLRTALTAMALLKRKQVRERRFGQIVRLNCRRVVLVGSSFGSSIALLAAANAQTDALVLFAPVFFYGLMRISGVRENLSGVLKFLQRERCRSYRISNINQWQQFFNGREPSLDLKQRLEKFEGQRLYIIRGDRDRTITRQALDVFRAALRNRNVMLRLHVINVAGVGHNPGELALKAKRRLRIFLNREMHHDG